MSTFADRGTWKPGELKKVGPRGDEIAMREEPETPFPREDIEASRRDKRLQARQRREVEEARQAHPELVCPECGSAEHVTWFYFRSPDETWRMLCGTAGPMAFCDTRERQVAYVRLVMN